MSITDNELAAFADGELPPLEARRIEQAVAADPALAEKLAAHHDLKARLAGHFASTLAEPPPDRLTALLRPPAAVVDLEARREERAGRRASLPRWTWIAGPALAASLLIAVLMPGRGDAPVGYADAQLANVLENQLVADQDVQAEVRVLLSFVREEGDYCRVYASAAEGGIACRDGRGWALVERARGTADGGSEYQQAGSLSGDLLARAQDLAVGGALDAQGELAARRRDWRN